MKQEKQSQLKAAKAYFDRVMQNAVRLEQLKAAEVEALRRLFSDVLAHLDTALLKGEVTEMGQRAFDMLVLRLRTDISGEFAEYVDSLNDTLLGVAETSLKMEAAAAASAGATLTAPTARLSTSPIAAAGGRLKSEVLAEFTAQEAMRIVAAVRMGRHQGKTNAQVRQMVVGTKAKKHADGIINVSLRHATTVVRTLMAHEAMEARREIAEAWGVESIQILATLDGRTSTVCRSLDHRVFPLADNVLPPFHPNCRSTFIFVLPDSVPFRASMDGQVTNVSYYEWLATQPADFQDEVLGKERGELFRSGRVSPERFGELQLDKNFRPITLEQLRRLL